MEIKISKLTSANQKMAKEITTLALQLGYQNRIKELSRRLEFILESNYDCVFIAQSDDQVIGWVHALVAVRVESPIFVEITGLVVDENFRGKKVGQKLIEAVKDWVNDLEIPVIKVRCNVIRTESHKFYEALGFTLDKEQKVFELSQFNVSSM